LILRMADLRFSVRICIFRHSKLQKVGNAYVRK
jgi:hypothetical protein